MTTSRRPTVFYHGTSLEAILAIQESGFRVDLAGTNAGAMPRSDPVCTSRPRWRRP
jgi:hypothetical protein